MEYMPNEFKVRYKPTQELEVLKCASQAGMSWMKPAYIQNLIFIKKENITEESVNEAFKGLEGIIIEPVLMRKIPTQPNELSLE